MIMRNSVKVGVIGGLECLSSADNILSHWFYAIRPNAGTLANAISTLQGKVDLTYARESDACGTKKLAAQPAPDLGRNDAAKFRLLGIKDPQCGV
jgi:hypothetical protein